MPNKRNKYLTKRFFLLLDILLILFMCYITLKYSLTSGIQGTVTQRGEGTKVK